MCFQEELRFLHLLKRCCKSINLNLTQQIPNLSIFQKNFFLLSPDFGFELVVLETFASLKERDNYALNTHQPWPKERNRREKPRNRYVAELANERLERERERDALALIFCPFSCAPCGVYINLDSPNSKGFPSPNSLVSRGDSFVKKRHTPGVSINISFSLSLPPFKTETVRPETTHARA